MRIRQSLLSITVLAFFSSHVAAKMHCDFSDRVDAKLELPIDWSIVSCAPLETNSAATFEIRPNPRQSHFQPPGQSVITGGLAEDSSVDVLVAQYIRDNPGYAEVLPETATHTAYLSTVAGHRFHCPWLRSEDRTDVFVSACFTQVGSSVLWFEAHCGPPQAFQDEDRCEDVIRHLYVMVLGSDIGDW